MPRAHFVLEPLEPRLLMSAGPLSPALDPPPPELDNRYEAVYEADLLVDIGDAPLDVLTADSASMAQVTEADPSEAAPPTAESAATTASELVFIDTGVEDYQRLIDDLASQSDARRRIDVVLLDANRDGISQIGAALAGYSDLNAVHFVSHGSAGAVSLGSTRLDLDTLRRYSAEIKAWGDALAETGDILIYGCNLAASQAGQTLIESLGELTGADVAASMDNTGSAQLGGDWDLEYLKGHIDTALAFSTALLGNCLG
ncbi:MAG: DUF4347 domain-containing protein, partial [Planctomycetes bacterium]|nr:DUF4347 domain-containing protein [Planctomycetota bacterium]